MVLMNYKNSHNNINKLWDQKKNKNQFVVQNKNNRINKT